MNNLLTITDWIIDSYTRNGQSKPDNYSLAKLILINQCIISDIQPDNEGWLPIGNIDLQHSKLMNKPYTGKNVIYYINLLESTNNCLKWKQLIMSN